MTGITSEKLRKLRTFAASLSDDPHLRGCGNMWRQGAVGSAQEILKKPLPCKRKWLCPVCGFAAFRRETQKLTKRLRRWTTQGGAVGFLTLTQRHRIDDVLALLWDRMEAGWSAVVRGSGWRADRKIYGLHGYVRIAEIVHHPGTGWHVHLHVILLMDRQLDEGGLANLQVSLTARFVKGIKHGGGYAEAGNQDLRVMAAGTEGSLARYCFNGTTVSRSIDGSRSPMAILQDLYSTGEDLNLWEEYVMAVTTKMRMQVVTSNKIDSLRPLPAGTPSCS